jgi:hypothetical protein
MPRRTYDARKGRRRPSDHRVKYTPEQTTEITNRYVKRTSDNYTEREIRT